MLGALALGSLCGAGPAPEGTEVSLGATYGRYEVRPRGCGALGQTYRVQEPAMDASVRHRFDDGFTLGSSVTVAPGVGRSLDTTQPQTTEASEQPILWTGSLGLRAGHHGRWLGFELGPALLLRPEWERIWPVPSGELWVGRPDRLYGWASLFTGPTTGAIELSAMAGLGHRSRLLHLEAGYNGTAWQTRASTRVAPGLRLGAELAGGRLAEDQDLPDLRGTLRITIESRELGRSRPTSPASIPGQSTSPDRATQ